MRGHEGRSTREAIAAVTKAPAPLAGTNDDTATAGHMLVHEDAHADLTPSTSSPSLLGARHSSSASISAPSWHLPWGMRAWAAPQSQGVKRGLSTSAACHADKDSSSSDSPAGTGEGAGQPEGQQVRISLAEALTRLVRGVFK